MSVHIANQIIKKEWTDYNNHLNVAFYVHIFDIAADVMLDNFNMGGISAKKDKNFKIHVVRGVTEITSLKECMNLK